MKKIIQFIMMLALIVPAFSYQSYVSAAGEAAALPAVLIQDTFR